VIREMAVLGITRNTLRLQKKTNSSFDHNHTYATPSFEMKQELAPNPAIPQHYQVKHHS